ncbi:hypothetical protein Tco_0589570, partial [Tanacetum coccineum]
ELNLDESGQRWRDRRQMRGGRRQMRGGRRQMRGGKVIDGSSGDRNGEVD